MLRLTTITAVMLFITACGSSNVNAPASPDPTPTTPPPSGKLSFTSWVNDQFANTSDLTEPVDVTELDFELDANDNPQAFDSLLDNNGS